MIGIALILYLIFLGLDRVLFFSYFLSLASNHSCK